MKICIYDNDSLHNVVLFVPIFCVIDVVCIVNCAMFCANAEKRGISLDRSMAFASPSHLLHLHVFYINI